MSGEPGQLHTFFDLGALGRVLSEFGAPETATDLWITQSLRDYFAASHADHYLPLANMLKAELPRTLASLQIALEESAQQRIVASLSELEPAEGARQASAALRDAGVEMVALTNSSREQTVELLERCGLRQHFSEVFSADDVCRSKPHRQVYDQVVNLERDAWLVAAHGWDILGAGAAGLRTVWIGHSDDYMSVFPRPLMVADDLAQAAERILAYAQ